MHEFAASCGVLLERRPHYNATLLGPTFTARDERTVVQAGRAVTLA